MGGLKNKQDHYVAMEDPAEGIPRSHSKLDQKPGTSGLFAATVNLSKSFLGAASFAFPWSLVRSGFWVGIFSTVIFATIAAYTLTLFQKLQREEKIKGRITYVELAEKIAGPCAKIGVLASIAAMTLGVCSSYLVFIGESLASVINSNNYTLSDVTHHPAGLFQEWILILFILPLVIATSFIPGITQLTWTSAVGTVFILACMVINAVEGIVGRISDPINMTDVLVLVDGPVKYIDIEGTTTHTAHPNDWRAFPLFIGNVAFIFCIHTVGLPISQSLKSPKSFVPAVIMSTAFVTVLNLMFGLVIWLIYNTEVKANSVLNMTAHSIFVDVIKCLLSAVMLMTYVLFLFPFIELTYTWPCLVEANCAVKAIVKIAVVGITALIAVAFTAGGLESSFSLITNLTGGVANTFVGLIFPPLLYLIQQRKKRRLTAVKILVNGSVFLFGCFVMINSLVGTIICAVGVMKC